MGQGGMSSGGYASGSSQRNMHLSAGTGIQRGMNMLSSSLSSGSQSIPEIAFLEEEISEADNSNTVFVQNHGSAGSNGMQNHGSSGNYGIQNHGGFAMQNHGSSGSFGMQNQGSSGSYGMQSHGSSGSVGMQNHGSSSSVGMQNHGSSSSVGIQNHGSSGSGISGMNYQSVGYY